MLEKADSYLHVTMKLMQASMKEFNRLLRAVAMLYAAYEDEELAGFYWTAERE
jgi:putative methionine-R-sulfoxide reductase with GAF domain